MIESEILKKLNEEQIKPASTIEGAVLVTAGAGSGKTRMLTHRIAHMVKDLGISPFNILAITFTNKAANEMKSRLLNMIDNVDYMWIYTFHSMCARILRNSIEKMEGYNKNFSIYGDIERTRVIKRILESIKTDITVETFSWHISNAKNNLLSPEQYARFIRDPKKCKLITSVYDLYEKELQKANALDFDDLLCKTYKLLKINPELLDYYQEKFKYIFVDEFQDTNTAQYELVKLLSTKYKNILAVGDEDQCIYSWRGAQVENVKQFTKDYENCQVFKLEQNYRSTKKIIALANKLIKNNENRIDKNLWTNNDDGLDVELKQTYNDIEEAEFVAEKIAQLVSNGNAKYSDFSILMRVNSQSRILEEKLLTYNIPHKVYGGFKFFERKEIKDATAYLYLASNPNDTEATNRMLAFPKKGIGDVSIAQINELANTYKVSEMDIICNASYYGIKGSLLNKLNSVRDLFIKINELKDRLSLVDFVTEVIKIAGIKEAIGNKTDEDINRCMNVDDLIKSVSEFASVNKDATIDDFLQSITLMRDSDSMSEDDDFVTLITVHTAKGLEFNTVFIVGLNDGLFPLSRAINRNDPNELEEERRLMYVAVTRAKRRLYLSRAKTKFDFQTRQSGYSTISRFLPEMFDDLKDKNNKNTNGSVSKSNIYNTGFDNYLNKTKKQESLDHMMSTHVNIVNVSKKPAQAVNQSSNMTISISDYSKFKKGLKVRHQHFGDGVVTLGVTDFASAFVTINFEKVGIKTLSLKYAKLEIIE